MELSMNLIEAVKKNKELPLFHFKYFDNGQYLITNEIGEYAFLNLEEFTEYITGKVSQKHSRFDELNQKSFLRSDDYIKVLAKKYKQKYSYLHWPTGLHIMVLTLRCNHKCQYCHASVGPEDQMDLDMTKETAKKVIDTIFSSPAKNMTVEFQGGEPLLNWDVLKFSVEYIRQKEKETGKNILITLVSNFSLMDDEKMQFIVDNEMGVATSLDGPEDVHNANRLWMKGNSFKSVMHWMEKLTKKFKEVESRREPGALSLPAAMPTITRGGIKKWKELVDLYVDLGLIAISLRPLNPIGYAKQTWDKIGYTADEYMDFYEKTLDYIIDLNKKGVFIAEKMSTYLLARILEPVDPAYTDLRSPCGGGIGQIAYDIDGGVYTCDEGRMISRMGDEVFKMGDVNENTWEELIDSDACKSISSVSCTEGVAGLTNHVYKPYIGVCPAHNFASTQNMQPNFYELDYYKRHERMLDILFKKLQNPIEREILQSWIQK